MDKKGYDFLVEEDFYYTFVSSGKKGDIAKIVVFQEMTQGNYNLVLADYDFEKDAFSDTIVSNNGDMPKIMSTVTQIILDFFRKFPESCVVLEANSIPKSRLYNRIVKNYYKTLQPQIQILVETQDSLEEYNLGQEHNKFYLYKRQLKSFAI